MWRAGWRPAWRTRPWPADPLASFSSAAAKEPARRPAPAALRLAGDQLQGSSRASTSASPPPGPAATPWPAGRAGLGHNLGAADGARVTAPGREMTPAVAHAATRRPNGRRHRGWREQVPANSVGQPWWWRPPASHGGVGDLFSAVAVVPNQTRSRPRPTPGADAVRRRRTLQPALGEHAEVWGLSGASSTMEHCSTWFSELWDYRLMA